MKITGVRQSLIHGLEFLAAVAMILSISSLMPVSLHAEDYGRLGARWQVSEQDWTGVWTRRGDSNSFDAHWTNPEQHDIRGVVEMRLDDRNVRITRTDLYSNQRCEYRGEISRDGRTARGWLSCNNGPRVNWNANIYFDRGSFQGNTETIGPYTGPTQRYDGPIVPKYNQGYSPWRFDLTGVWRCNDGGTYYVRQLGNNVWWYGESSNGQWSNIFHGAMDGDWLDGRWLDVPKGRDRNNGALRIRVDSANEFHREQKSGDDFGGSHWRRVR